MEKCKKKTRCEETEELFSNRRFLRDRIRIDSYLRGQMREELSPSGYFKRVAAVRMKKTEAFMETTLTEEIVEYKSNKKVISSYV